MRLRRWRGQPPPRRACRRRRRTRARPSLLVDDGLGAIDPLLGSSSIRSSASRCASSTRRDDVEREVEDALEVSRADVEQDAEPRRRALEVPDVADRAASLMPHPLAAHLRARDLDATLVADDALVSDALVLPAVAPPSPCRPEDALVEEAVLLRFERAVVDCLRLRDLAARRPTLDLIGRCQADPDRVEIVDFKYVLLATPAAAASLLRSRPGWTRPRLRMDRWEGARAGASLPPRGRGHSSKPWRLIPPRSGSG